MQILTNKRQFSYFNIQPNAFKGKKKKITNSTVGLCVMLKVSVHQEAVTVLNLNALKNHQIPTELALLL